MIRILTNPSMTIASSVVSPISSGLKKILKKKERFMVLDKVMSVFNNATLYMLPTFLDSLI